jgi:hypothetical protein
VITAMMWTLCPGDTEPRLQFAFWYSAEMTLQLPCEALTD